MVSGKENQKLAEMVNFFKNKLIVESCFHQAYGAKKMGGSNLQPVKNGQELTIGFVRDQIDEDEFYL